MRGRSYIIISMSALILIMLATVACEKIAPQHGGDQGEGVMNVIATTTDSDQGVFAPLSDIGRRALTSFAASLAALIVVISAIIPWLALLFFLGWGFIKLLRIYLRHKRARKKNGD